MSLNDSEAIGPLKKHWVYLNGVARRSTEDTLYRRYSWDQQFCPVYQGVPNSGSSVIFLVGVVLRNWAVKHNGGSLSSPNSMW